MAAACLADAGPSYLADVFASDLGAVLRTRTLSEPRGFMKMLVAVDSDEILGFTAFGTEASELMTAVQVAMLGRLPYTVLRDAILTHPATGEGLTYLLRGMPTSHTAE